MNKKISSKEKLSIWILLSIDIITKMMAKFMGIGFPNFGFSIIGSHDTSAWWVYFSDIFFIFIIYLARKHIFRNNLSRLGFIAIFAGAIGNFVWRLLFGRIIEWIDLLYVPTFNFADVLIILGLILSIIGVVWNETE
jgi:signal peptidase II